MRLLYFTHLPLLVCSAVALQAADYYVSEQGNDANPGTLSSPFRTLSKGVAGLKPGDTLLIRAGTYVGSSQLRHIPGGESWEKPVTIRAYPGERPTLIPEPKETVLYITGTKYVIIDGLVVDAKGGHDGIKLTYFTGGRQAHHIRIKNCEVKNASNQGLLVAGEGNEFINLDVHDNGTTGFHHGIYLSADRNLIDGGRYYRNAGWGLHIYPKASNTIVRNVRSFENRATGLGLVWGANNVAYNNIVYSNGSGIHLSGDSPRCYNNSIYGNRGEGLSVANADNGSNGTRNADVRNNIVFLNEAGIKDYATGAGTVLANNLQADPHFVDAARGDFRLRPGSPAIDKGADLTSAGVKSDIQGNPRPRGAGFDIGAYEFSPEQAQRQGGGGTIQVAHHFPPVAEIPSQPQLPDPLVPGRRAARYTSEQWFGERRPELAALIQHYMYGLLPPAPAKTAGGFHGTIGHSDAWNRIGSPTPTHRGGQRRGRPPIAALHEFFNALPFWRLAPFIDLSGGAPALAEPGSTYVVYLSHGGTVTLGLTAAGGALSACWFTPRVGKFLEECSISNQGRTAFTAPDAEDSALLVRPKNR